MKNFKYSIIFMMAFPFLIGCIQTNEKKNTLRTDEKGFVILSDEQIENIDRRRNGGTDVRRDGRAA